MASEGKWSFLKKMMENHVLGKTGPEAAEAWHTNRERLLERLGVPFVETIVIGTFYLCDVAYIW